MTIVDAIRTAMRARGEPMTAAEVHANIAQAKLYEFHTENPGGHCSRPDSQALRGTQSESAFKGQVFPGFGNGQFEVLEAS